MGVYINTEMPTSCSDCPIGDSLCCTLMPGVPALWKEYTLAIRTNRRHKDCPLIPVPKHGALIDRDDFFATCPELVDGYKRITDDLVVIPAEEEETT